MSNTISSDVERVLRSLRIQGNTVRITEQLDRPLYQAVNEVLERLGGKWNKSAKAHIFPGDPTERLNTVLQAGKLDPKIKTGYFPTPPEIGKRMVEMLDLKPGDKVLEPSAGQGGLLDQLPKGTHVTIGEILPENIQILKEKGYTVNFDNFLGVEIGEINKVVMNPPFENQQDIEHVTRALRMLQPGGTLVSVMSPAIKFRDNKKTTDFLEMLDRDYNYEIIDLPAGSFKESRTGVNTVLLKVEKPMSTPSTVSSGFVADTSKVDKKLADRSHMGTSWEPEKRAEQSQPKPQTHSTTVIPRAYYTSAHGTMSMAQFIETEVKERGNYSLEDVQTWIKKYSIPDTARVIWVSPKKWVANKYNLLADEADTAEDIPDSEMDVEEIPAIDGFIIPESDDGDEGFLFVYKTPKPFVSTAPDKLVSIVERSDMSKDEKHIFPKGTIARNNRTDEKYSLQADMEATQDDKVGKRWRLNNTSGDYVFVSDQVQAPNTIVLPYPDPKVSTLPKDHYYFFRNKPSIGMYPSGEVMKELWVKAQVTQKGNMAFGWVAYREELSSDALKQFDLFIDEAEDHEKPKEPLQLRNRADGIELITGTQTYLVRHLEAKGFIETTDYYTRLYHQPYNATIPSFHQDYDRILNYFIKNTYVPAKPTPINPNPASEDYKAGYNLGIQGRIAPAVASWHDQGQADHAAGYAEGKEVFETKSKPVQEPTDYFTLRKAQSITKADVSALSDPNLEKTRIILTDYIRFIESSDEYSRKTLIKGGYFANVEHPDASGMSPVDIWLHNSLKSTLERVHQEQDRRKHNKYIPERVYPAMEKEEDDRPIFGQPIKKQQEVLVFGLPVDTKKVIEEFGKPRVLGAASRQEQTLREVRKRQDEGKRLKGQQSLTSAISTSHRLTEFEIKEKPVMQPERIKSLPFKKPIPFMTPSRVPPKRIITPARRLYAMKPEEKEAIVQERRTSIIHRLDLLAEKQRLLREKEALLKGE